MAASVTFLLYGVAVAVPTVFVASLAFGLVSLLALPGVVLVVAVIVRNRQEAHGKWRL